MTQDVRWRLLPFRTDDPYTCMAIDKTIAESVAAGGPPTLRFYRWSGNGAVSYGVSQAVSDFDTTYCDENKIGYVRRFTGGRVMYHGPQDLTYAMAAPLSLYPSRLPLTSDTSRWIMQFLEKVGLQNVQYTGNSSILTNAKKVSGSSPHYEQRKAVFQHGSVFVGTPYSALAEIFRLPEELVRERITTVSEHSALSLDILLAEFQYVFLSQLPHDVGVLTSAEEQRVEELKREYASKAWMEAGTLPMGICTVNWGIYPELEGQLPADLRARLVNKPSEQ